MILHPARPFAALASPRRCDFWIFVNTGEACKTVKIGAFANEDRIPSVFSKALHLSSAPELLASSVRRTQPRSRPNSDCAGPDAITGTLLTSEFP
jgi:hypothetical protein